MRQRVQSPDATCPDCGHDAAHVRTNGNAYAAVCEKCRRIDVHPMLIDDQLDVFDEDSAEPCEVVDLRTRRRLASTDMQETAKPLSVTFSAPWL